MESGRPVKLFRNGRNQAVRIPRDFELPGEDAVMRREGDHLIIEPVESDVAQRKGLLRLLASWEPIDEDFGSIDDTPTRPVSF